MKSIRWALCLWCCVACSKVNIDTSEDDDTEADASAPSASRTDASTSKNDAGTAQSVAATVQLDTKIRIGRFQLLLGAAKLSVANRASVVVDFTATSLSTESSTPLSGFKDGEVVLTLGGRDVAGTVKVDSVAAEGSGTGTITFSLDEVEGELLESAVLTLGSSQVNQVIVHFDDPKSTNGFEDISSPTTFTVDADELTDIEVDRIWVTFQDTAANKPLPAGKANLILPATFVGKANINSSRNTQWSMEHTSLKRPDGKSVVSPLNIVVSAGGQRVPARLVYELAIPVSGTYELTFSKPVINNNGNKPVTQAIVVP